MGQRRVETNAMISFINERKYVAVERTVDNTDIQIYVYLLI